MAKKEETKVEELESVGRALSNTEAFIEKNQKIILITVLKNWCTDVGKLKRILKLEKLEWNQELNL